jgi:hypothetical protein
MSAKAATCVVCELHAESTFKSACGRGERAKRVEPQRVGVGSPRAGKKVGKD